MPGMNWAPTDAAPGRLGGPGGPFKVAKTVREPQSDLGRL
jgi:hypothetical protein